MRKPIDFLVHSNCIIAGFPGVGKSALEDLLPTWVKVKDSDSSLFAKDSTWPEAYIQDLVSSTEDIVLCSTHSYVLQGLIEDNTKDLLLIYPKRECKEEYLKRYKDRGSSESFIKLLDTNWDSFIDSLNNTEGPRVFRWELNSGEYLSDFIYNQIPFQKPLSFKVYSTIKFLGNSLELPFSNLDYATRKLFADLEMWTRVGKGLQYLDVLASTGAMTLGGEFADRVRKMIEDYEVK